MDVTEEVLGIANKYLSQVRRSGPDDIMSICPFHLKADGSEERRPSFAMSLSKGLYFCHACQEKGNLFTFLKGVGLTRHQIETGYQPMLDAVGRNMPPAPDPLKPNVFSESPIQESLLGLFDFCPKALLEKGFAEETLSRFDVGFDKDHMRITFPLRDLKGNLVGISGRNVTGDWPKYKVYDTEYRAWDLPSRTGWDKRTVLWNAHVVYPGTYFQSSLADVVVVEGFKACMWLWQSGITSTVALLGTYLSYEQHWILERMGAQVYLFLDNNEAGITGTLKTGEKLMRSLPVKVIEYPERLANDEDAQPDDLTIEELLEAKSSAVSYAIWSMTN